MRNSIVLLLTLLSPLVAAGHDRSGSSSAAVHNNSNRVFNSIIDGMRQFGGALHHNGMTLYLAHVPKYTEFYHGTYSPYRINGTEWLAFEPEHSLFFASEYAKRGPSVSGAESKFESDAIANVSPRRHHSRQLEPNADIEGNLASSRPGRQGQQPLVLSQDDDKQGKGYLHTYQANKTLRLIYIDGQGAAKSRLGTLDTQDLVIRNLKRGTGETRGPEEEEKRADEMCAVAVNAWHGQIDGFLRMEGGFEVILCDFARNLDLISVQTVLDNDIARNFGMMGYLSAIAARYDGIGGNRVSIDFESMVSMYAYDGLVFIDDVNQPHVDNTSSQLAAAQRQLDRLATSDISEHGHNWQATADMIVSHYSDKVEYLASSAINSLADVKDHANYFLRPYTDDERRDPDSEILKCASQYWPVSQPPITTEAHLGIAASAVRSVAFEICTTISDLRSSVTTFQEAQSRIQGLKQWLDWANFKRCRGCRLGEYCFVPVWPWGSKDDYAEPQCRTAIPAYPGKDKDYWGHERMPQVLGGRWAAPEE